MRLSALERSEIPAFISRTLNYVTSEEVDALFCDNLYAQSCGNPMYLCELLQNITQQKLLGFLTNGKVGLLENSNGKHSVLDRHTSLNGLLLKRLDRLGTGVRKTLQLGAMFGSEFKFSDLRLVMECHSFGARKI